MLCQYYLMDHCCNLDKECADCHSYILCNLCRLKCKICFDSLCNSCIIKCSKCLNIVCKLCMMVCRSCKNIICDDDISSCYLCDESLCGNCIILFEYKTYCKDCLKYRCIICKQIISKLRIFSCGFCKAPVCRCCINYQCSMCRNEILCNNCIINCETCHDKICVNCYDKHYKEITDGNNYRIKSNNRDYVSKLFNCHICFNIKNEIKKERYDFKFIDIISNIIKYIKFEDILKSRRICYLFFKTINEKCIYMINIYKHSKIIISKNNTD